LTASTQQTIINKKIHIISFNIKTSIYTVLLGTYAFLGQHDWVLRIGDFIAIGYLLVILTIVNIETARSLENGWKKVLIFFPTTLAYTSLCMFSFFLGLTTEMMRHPTIFLACRMALIILILTELIELRSLYKYT